jgi:hypothetical protein
MDIIHRPHVSESGFYFRLQMEPIQFGPIDRASHSLEKE